MRFHFSRQKGREIYQTRGRSQQDFSGNQPPPIGAFYLRILAPFSEIKMPFALSKTILAKFYQFACFQRVVDNRMMKNKPSDEARYLLGLSALLFVAGLFMPAVDLVPWMPGVGVFILSFLGVVIGGGGSLNHFLACVTGAVANILMMVTAFRILAGQKRLCFECALIVAGLTLLVQLPLNGITNNGLDGLSYGLLDVGWICGGIEPVCLGSKVVKAVGIVFQPPK